MSGSAFLAGGGAWEFSQVVGTYRPFYAIYRLRSIVDLVRFARSRSFTVKTSVHGSGARSCFMGLAQLFCIRRAIVLESLTNKWQRITSHLLKLQALRRVWSAIGQHLAEVKRRGREVEDLHSSCKQDVDRS